MDNQHKGPSLLGESAFRQALRRAVVLPTMALVVALALLLAVQLYLLRIARLADHSNAVLAQISRVEKLAVDMETGVRGYEVTGDPVFLEPFQTATLGLSHEFDALEKLVATDVRQLVEAQALRKSHGIWSELATNMRQQVQAQLPADVVAHLRGKGLMDAVRTHINSMQEYERGLLAERAATRGRLRVAAISAVPLFIVILAPMVVFSVRRGLMRLNRSYEEVLGTLDSERGRLDEMLSKMRSSEERFRRVFEYAATGIAIADMEAKLRQCNPAFCALLGYREEELCQKTVIDLVHPADRGECAALIRGLQEGRFPFYEIEGRYLHKNGEAVWVRKFVSVLRGAGGAPTHLVGLVTDVRERKHTEILLDSQKRSLEMVVSGAPLGEVLTYLARVVEEQSDGKAVASILLLDNDGLLRNGASPTLPGDYLKAIDGLKPCAGVGTCCAAAATCQVVLTPDIANDPKWETLKHLPLGLGFVAAWSQPITASDGRVLGTFGTYFRECREPTHFERQSVEMLARAAAVAVERRRVEDDRKRFVSLAENSSDFIGICGPDFLPLFVNPAGLAMVGLDDMEHARRTPVKEFFFPEDQESMVKHFFPAVLAQGNQQVEIRFRHFKTREALWMLYNVWVVNDDQGRFAGLATVSRDITERKRAEEALRASEERYRSLFESIDEGFCVIEMIFDGNQRPVDYRFIEVNPAFERQAGMHDALGKRMLEFVSEIEPHWLENYGRVALTGEPMRFAEEYKSLGSWFDVYAFRVGEPQSRRVAVLFNNITKRKDAEASLLRSRAALSVANEELAVRARQLDQTIEQRTAELRETIQQLETFSYSIVHDMRAPLRSMRSFAGFLQQRYTEKLDPPARDYVRRIMDSAARMDALITDVLSYSKVSRGAADLAPVNLDRLVPEIIEQYPNLHEMTSAIQVERPLPNVVGNTALLSQVFSNLLGNALKFVPEGRSPQVRVRSETNHKFVRIWVEDNGIGVPPEHRERIFSLFQRLQRPGQYAGTGVGLAIVKRAVERMGGATGVESAGGSGSRFWIDLPLGIPEREMIELN